MKPQNKNKRVIPTVSLVARMLKDKGVREFVAAARKLNTEKINALEEESADPSESGSIPLEDRSETWWRPGLPNQNFLGYPSSYSVKDPYCPPLLIPGLLP